MSLPILLLLALFSSSAFARGSEPLLDGMGTHHVPITTSSPLAQRYFDQGIALTIGFNHEEAIRSFTEAAELDRHCAMCYWGIAFALGPNINRPMPDEAVLPAWRALSTARLLAPRVSERERHYIKALEARYAREPAADRSALDRAFADSMRELVRHHPDDQDAAVFFAEAVMDTMPWNYWTQDGLPRPGTSELVATLERVLAKNPNHPGAIHLYIHALEASPHAERALAPARRIADLIPGAGHIVHMPSHIYLRLGLYHDAAEANARAIAVDERYIAKYDVKGFYPLMYYTHNLQFFWYAAATEGRYADSMASARKAADYVRPHMQHMAMAQWVASAPLFGLARFGRWSEILEEAEPDDAQAFLKAMWHYARGLAFARRGDAAKAQVEADALASLVQSPAMQALERPEFPGKSTAEVAEADLAAELAWARGDQGKRIEQLEEAVRRQDALQYMEPPFWYFPERQALGAALLERGRAADAERVFREELAIRPNDGRTLFGLAESLTRLGLSDQAASTRAELAKAWRYADTTLTSPRL